MSCADDGRADPDELLRAVEREEGARGRGRLKVFFGYAAGVGKTYAMLKAAHAARRRGVDVVAGYIEPHARPQTAALARGLETLPVRAADEGGIALREFDLDAALARRPQLILVDELAHTNAAGSRHEKRYQDVEELLRNGIDVWTTVNVQHIESLNDQVASITGVVVRERIPDRLIDEADQVELVDIEPSELIERLNAGQVYQGEQVGRALGNFFSLENLTALREVAMRRCADHVNRANDGARVRGNRSYHTGEHVMVCLSSSPSNQRIVRAAARMAGAFHASFSALHVEEPGVALAAEDRERLRRNAELAEQLGARVETSQGADVAFQIAEFARLAGVSKVVLGRSTARPRPFGPAPLTERLVALAPNLDVYIIPDGAEGHEDSVRRRLARMPWGVNARDTLRMAAVLLACVLVGFVFDALGFLDANIIAVFLLGAVVVAMVTSSRLYAPLASLLSVMLFNFCFVSPRFSLGTFSRSYIVTYAVMFVVALLASALAVRLGRQARQSARAAYRTTVLLDANRLLQQASGEERVCAVAAGQLVKLLERDVVFYLPEGASVGAAHLVRALEGAPARPELVGDDERAVAAWSLKNAARAGATTSTLPESACLYLPVRSASGVHAVMGVAIDGRPLEALESSLALSIVGECALALEGERAAREREEAAVLAKNEQLRANLLRSIAHDLRTPLTSISGAADVLLTQPGLPEDRRRGLLEGIHTDAQWLCGLVENLLSVTRLEDGSLKLAMSVELVEEVVDEAARHMAPRMQGRTLAVRPCPELLMARMDARLIVQVIVNLIDNAVKYTPAGSTVTVSTARRGGDIMVEVADDGPGVPDDAKPHVFEMFYTVRGNKPADGRRSLGLGMALCKSIVAAHGGSIEVADTVPHGATVRFTLPAEEVDLHE